MLASYWGLARGEATKTGERSPASRACHDVLVSAAHLHHVFHTRVELAPGTDRLIALSALAELDPVAHESALARYDDTAERRRLRDTVIPILDRKWTEVVFLSPVHPHAIWTAWRELAGRELPPMEFWAIPVESLPTDTVIFDRTLSAVGERIRPEEVATLDPASFRTALETTPGNREWLANLAASGKTGAWFNRTPHVLSGSAVSLADAEVMNWAAPWRRADVARHS